MEAADQTASPVILQASKGARSHAVDIVLRHLMLAAIESYPHIPVCFHLDHGNGPETCLFARVNGYSSVTIDGSLREDCKTPGYLDYNVSVTSQITRAAHFVGISVEGELGVLGSLETSDILAMQA